MARRSERGVVTALDELSPMAPVTVDEMLAVAYVRHRRLKIELAVIDQAIDAVDRSIVILRPLLPEVEP